jgi:quercetin dioxygenase-like cupin family protein
MTESTAEILMPSAALTEDLDFFAKRLGFRLEMIYPADDPRVAVISGHGLRLRLERGAEAPAPVIRILAEDPGAVAGGARALIAPNGARIEIDVANPPLILPETEHAFVVRRLADQAPWVIGRAGMQYRDLIPDRLGGAIIASHIRIPDGGPVPDMVHYHTIGFQLIFCYRGWVDLVYEDQGPPFRLSAGCCVIQPPQIRHRVLFASDNIEVIEIGVPAEHLTTIDHRMTLPNTDAPVPGREWDGQSFVHHRAEGAAWAPFRVPGFVARDTTIAANTRNVAGVQVVRAVADGAAGGAAGGAGGAARHDADILFGFVMEGAMTLEGEGKAPFRLTPGDAFVIPPGMATRYAAPSPDFELLEVSLPGAFATLPA